MTLLLLGTMFILMGLGVPIFAALGLSTVVVSTQHAMVFPLTIPQRMFFALDMFGLMAIPYFVFCADIMGRGKIGERLVLLCRAFLGHLPGGMAVAAVAACLVFGAISGAGVAALVAFGALVYRLMKEGQYTDEFSSGLIASSSTLAMLIPPSIVHVVFATITATSVAALFMSGLGMGLLLAIALATYSVIWAKWKKLPLLPKIPWRDRWKPLVSALPALGLIVVIMGGIYGGVLSVTEAAGVAAFYAFIVEVFVYRTLSFKDIFKIAISSARSIAMIMILISAGATLAHIMTIMRLPHAMAALLGNLSPVALLLVINLIFLVVSMFIDPTSTIIILVPLLFPAAMAAGIDPVHMGTTVVLNVAIGMLTPPFGLNLFVGTAVFKQSFGQMVRGVFPFILISLVVLLFAIFIPGLSTWLPSMLLR